MEPEKLDELHRQRRLVEEHLRWLDGLIEETERSAGHPGSADAAPSATSHTPSAPLSSMAHTGPEPEVLPSLDRTGIKRTVARGCAIYLAAAGFLLFLLWLVYYLLAD